MIPIKNLYFMLCYAWKVLPEKSWAKVGAEDSNDLLNLFADAVVRGFQLLRKRGFFRSYVTELDETRQIRGKISFMDSLRKLSHEQGKMYCNFDELTHNVLPNQILKSTLLLLYRYRDLDHTLKAGISECLQCLDMVDAVRLDAKVFRVVRMPGRQSVYCFLLNICRIIVEGQMVNEKNGRGNFSIFENEKFMARLFEEFLRSFYQFELMEASARVPVRRQQLRWLFEGDTARSSHLPGMETDLMFRYGGRQLIMDAKFYKEMMSAGRFEQSHGKLRSPNLYQLFSYMINCEDELKRQGQEDMPIHGILVYPVAEGKVSFHESYAFGLHRLTVFSINLNQSHHGIKKDLLELVSTEA